MKLLLDTHVWIWQILGEDRLPRKFKDLLSQKDHEIFFSPISAWEILILERKRKLFLGNHPVQWIRDALKNFPMKEAPLNTEVAIVSRELKLPHDDPADRFLAATALVYDLKILTVDKVLKKARGVPTV